MGIDPADRDTQSWLDLSGMRRPSDAAAFRAGKHSSTWQSLACGTGIEADYLNDEIELLAREDKQLEDLLAVS